MLVTFSISVDVQGYHVMARRKKETVLKKVLKHERKTSPKANIPGPPGTQCDAGALWSVL